MNFLAIKDFAEFQHYRDRNPPWIKLYAKVLTNADFLQLPEAAQAQLIKLWILASQMGNPLPNKPKLLGGKIGTTSRLYLPEIIASGFLIPCNENASTDASGVLAESYQNASAPVRGRTQRAENRGIVDDEQPIGEPTLSALYLTIWCNKAVATRWGEQPNPYTQANAIQLAELLAEKGVEWQVARLSIYRQSEHSKQARPPRSQNYFRVGILEDWERELSRRALRQSGESAPTDVAALRMERSGPTHGGAVPFVKILELVEERIVPGQPSGRFIRRENVAALGPDVLRAYDAVGGAEKFLNTPKADRTWLMRDFAKLLDGMSHDAAS